MNPDQWSSKGLSWVLELTITLDGSAQAYYQMAIDSGNAIATFVSQLCPIPDHIKLQFN